MKRPPSVWCHYGRNTVESLCVSSKSGFKGVLREPPGVFLRHGSKKIQQLDSRIKATLDVLWKFSGEIPENPIRSHFRPHASGYISAPANGLRHLSRLSGRRWSDMWSRMAVDRQSEPGYSQFIQNMRDVCYHSTYKRAIKRKQQHLWFFGSKCIFQEEPVGKGTLIAFDSVLISLILSSSDSSFWPPSSVAPLRDRPRTSKHVKWIPPLSRVRHVNFSFSAFFLAELSHAWASVQW